MKLSESDVTAILTKEFPAVGRFRYAVAILRLLDEIGNGVNRENLVAVLDRPVILDTLLRLGLVTEESGLAGPRLYAHPAVRGALKGYA